jgi:hypothetical protein
MEEFHKVAVPLAGELPSRFQIGDETDYTTIKWVEEAFRIAREKQPEVKEDELEFIPRYSLGKVSAIRFTESKVYYDIQDSYTQEITRDIPSHYVKKFAK